jgi:hypothetical protein
VADACNHVLLAIVARGKRDFESDEHARGYLGKAIRNRCVDAFRRRRREVAFDDVREGAVVDWSAADDSDAAAASAREQGAREAWARLEAEARIVADAMRPADRGGAFLQCFDELRALALETTTIDAVIRARPKVEGESPTPAALHQQHHRCRERLMQQIDHRETTGEIDPAMAEYLRNAVRFLKRRT